MTERSVQDSEVVALLRMVRGVAGVDVRIDSEGGIEAIEIRIQPDQSAKRVVRDVESALMTGLGVTVDHRLITIRENGHRKPAGAAENGNGAPARSLHLSSPTDIDSRRRVELIDVRCDPDGELYCETMVELESGGETFQAKVREADTSPTRVLAAGRATIEALRRTLEKETAVALEGVEEFAICDQPALIAAIRVRRGRFQRSYLGTALVEGTPQESAARAVLDALNRFWETQERVAD